MKVIAFGSFHGATISRHAGWRKSSDLHYGTVPAKDLRLPVIVSILSERGKDSEKNCPDRTTVKSGTQARVRWQNLMVAIKFASLRLVSKIRPSRPCCTRYYSVFPAGASFGTSHCTPHSRHAAFAWTNLPPLQASEVKGLFQHVSEPEDTESKTPSIRTVTLQYER
jgi:hypothetical protein